MCGASATMQSGKNTEKKFRTKEESEVFIVFFNIIISEVINIKYKIMQELALIPSSEPY